MRSDPRSRRPSLCLEGLPPPCVEALESRSLFSTVFADSPVPYRGGAESILAVADLNNDLLPDAVVRRYTGDGGFVHGIRFGQTSGQEFGALVALPVPPRSASTRAFVGAFTPGGEPDIVLVHEYGDREVLVGDGRGRFVLAESRRGSSVFAAGDLVSINGGRPSIAARDRWLTFDSLGRTRMHRLTDLGAGADAFGDVNGDHRTDAVVLNAGVQGAARVFLGLGRGRFALSATLAMPSAWDGGRVVLSDATADGVPDLVCATVEDSAAARGGLWVVPGGAGNLLGEELTFSTPVLVGSFVAGGWGDPAFVDVTAMVPGELTREPGGPRPIPSFVTRTWATHIYRDVPITTIGTITLHTFSGEDFASGEFVARSIPFEYGGLPPLPVVADLGRDGVPDLIDGHWVVRQQRENEVSRSRIAGVEVGPPEVRRPAAPTRLTRVTSISLPVGTSPGRRIEVVLDSNDDEVLNTGEAAWEVVEFAELTRTAEPGVWRFKLVTYTPEPVSFAGVRVFFRLVDARGFFSEPFAVVLAG